VRYATELCRDCREISRIAHSGPCLRKKVHFVVSNARMGPARQSTVGSLVALGEALADVIAVRAGHR
jgi:hypothetical protein